MIKKILGILILLIVVVVGGSYLYGRISDNSSTNSQSYSMVKYIEEVNEQVFLNVGIQDVESQENNTKIPWTKIGIPSTEKKSNDYSEL